MRRGELTRGLIESIIRNDNIEYVDAVDEKIKAIVSNAVEDLSKQISYVNLNNVILQPANELLNGAMTDNSKFVYFLAVDNAQIDLNTSRSSRFWKNFKNRIIYAWNNRKVKKKVSRRKRRKAEESFQQEKFNFDPANYNIYNLAEDLQTALSKYMLPTTILYLNDNRLTIVGKEDFGSNTQIVLILVLYDGEKFKYFVNKKRGYISVDFTERIQSLNEKIDRVGGVFIEVLKIFNVLYYDVNNYTPNQIFMESVLYNCPDNLFEKNEAYKSFIKIINYLSMHSLKEFKSVENHKNTIFKDQLCGNTATGFARLLSQLSNIK